MKIPFCEKERKGTISPYIKSKVNQEIPKKICSLFSGLSCQCRMAVVFCFQGLSPRFQRGAGLYAASPRQGLRAFRCHPSGKVVPVSGLFLLPRFPENLLHFPCPCKGLSRILRPRKGIILINKLTDRPIWQPTGLLP